MPLSSPRVVGTGRRGGSASREPRLRPGPCRADAADSRLRTPKVRRACTTRSPRRRRRRRHEPPQTQQCVREQQPPPANVRGAEERECGTPPEGGRKVEERGGEEEEEGRKEEERARPRHGRLDRAPLYTSHASARGCVSSLAGLGRKSYNHHHPLLVRS